MSMEQTFEHRLAALESSVKEIQDRLSPPSAVEKWWEKIGTITDREAFREAMEYARASRQADRPPDDNGEQS